MGKDLKGKDLGKGFTQRPDGRYEARARINGIKIDLYDKSLSKLRKDFEVERQRVLQDEKGVYSNLSLDEWYQEWFTKYKSPNLKTEASRVAYDRKIRNTFIRILGRKPLKDVTQLNIQTATNQLLEEEKYSTKTVKDALSAFHDCFDIAVLNRVITANPCQQIIICDKNEESKERRVLSLHEQEIFLNEISGCYYDEIFRIMLITGMRIGEVSALQWDDIDFNKKLIYVRRSMQTVYVEGRKIEEFTTPKTANSYRAIPFFDETENLFKSWRDKQYIYKKKLGARWRADAKFGDLVFTTTMGSPVTRYNIVHWLDKIENNINQKEIYTAGIEGREPVSFEHIHPHCFRHTFATRCFEKGLDPVVVQRIMGHANYSTTLSYTHLLEDKTKEAVQHIGSFLA